MIRPTFDIKSRRYAISPQNASGSLLLHKGHQLVLKIIGPAGQQNTFGASFFLPPRARQGEKMKRGQTSREGKKERRGLEMLRWGGKKVRRELWEGGGNIPPSVKI